MSYQVLARKWRPQTFATMVGQEHVLKALVNAFTHQRLHHAYLFTGTRGVGKTTIARILAKCFNCERGVSAEPCGQCTACIAIEEGRFVDVIEVDAASRTKVEDTRELLENVQYAPVAGRYKLYLIDEVHMLSTHSFNALLKTLEEPPPHVKFLLATTDPQKLPLTVLSRCLQFALKGISTEHITSHLQQLLAQENIAYNQAALYLLARAANGSMRDALSLTDQAISFGGGAIKDSDVRSMLGAIDHSLLYDIIATLAKADAVALFALLQPLATQAPDYNYLLTEMLHLLHRIAVAQAIPEKIPAIAEEDDHIETIRTLASTIAAEDIQLFYQIALCARRDLPLAADPRSGFEMALLRMLAFKPAPLETSAKARLTPTSKVLDSNTAASVVPSHDHNAQNVQKKSSHDRTYRALSTQSAAEQTVAEDIAVNISPPNAVQNTATQLQEANPALEQTTPQRVTSLEQLTPQNWPSCFEQWQADGVLPDGVLGNIVAHCALQRIDGHILYFTIDDKHALLLNKGYTERLQNHLAHQLGVDLQVLITVGTCGNETPDTVRTEKKQRQQRQLLDNLQQDPQVQCLMEHFDASIDLVTGQQ